MNAYIFPGQGAQFSGMGKELYKTSDAAREWFIKANDILGFDLMRIMFEGTAKELIETKVTQPAIYVHSVIQAKIQSIKPDMVAGHSLGEFSALAASRVFSFEDGLRLVAKRSAAMQTAAEKNKGIMAAILGLEDKVVEDVCEEIENVVPANYNCSGQLVISGDEKCVLRACEKLKEKGAKRAVVLAVGGAFHSPLMQAAQEELAAAIYCTSFNPPICPVYQNVPAVAVTSTNELKNNLIAQLTAPVKWTQSIENMIKGGAKSFTEIGPRKVLQRLVKKIDHTIAVN